MKRNIFMVLSGIAGLLLTAPVFAQTPGGGAAEPANKWIWITSGFSMAIASAVCGYAQSKATAAAVEGLARNPGARPGIQLALILALVFIESLALYTLLVVFVKVK